MAHENPNTDPQQYAERLLASYEIALEEGIHIAYPDKVGRRPLDVYPEPPSTRDQAPDPGWNADQESSMRQIMGEFGYGRETDRTISELGLGGAHVYIEPGQPHKEVAEVLAVENDSNANPNSWIFGGNPKYEISNPSEQDSAIQQVGFVPENQYDLSRAVATQMEGFVPLENEEVLPLSYGDKQNGFPVGQELTGQFIRIGQTKGRDVILLRIDGDKIVDESSGKPKLVDHPGPADTMKIISEARSLRGDSDIPLAFVTSSRYQASREIEAVRAGLATGRVIGVPTYGTVRLAEVRSESAPAIPEANQIPGELHVAARSAEMLKAELQAF